MSVMRGRTSSQALRFQQKLLIPRPVHPLVDRTALLSQLEQAIRNRRIVTLVAAAGWGKTTVLSQWAGSSSLPVAWFTLDQGDREPRIFLDYLLETINPFVPHAAKIGASLTTSTPKDLPGLIRMVALEIAAALAPFALVLDNFHVLDDGPVPTLPGISLILDLLRDLAEYATNCHLVFVSRVRPARVDLNRMVVQQRAAVFDYQSLQFSPADIQQLARIRYTLTLSEESARWLTEQFHGWVTGVVLMLDHALRGHELPSDFSVDTLPIHDFLTEQITSLLTPELQHFLEDISVLEDLSPQRCDTLRGMCNGACFLAEIRRRVLFISSRGGRLSFHDFFRQFLRMHLAQDPLREQALLYHAGNLYSNEEDLEQALSCYLAADAEDLAIVLLRTHIPRFRQHDRRQSLLTCFERLGTYCLDQNHFLPPDLLLAQAQIYGDLALWERAELAIQLAETIGDTELVWEARIAMADLMILREDFSKARAALMDLPVADLPVRLQFAYYLAFGRVQILDGTSGLAIRALELAHTLALSIIKSTHDPSPLASVYDYLGWVYALQGDRQVALGYLKRANICWQDYGNSERRAFTLNGLGWLAIAAQDYERARTALEAGLHLAVQAALLSEEVLLRCSLAELALLEGKLEQALARFSEAYALAIRMDTSRRIELTAVGAFWAASLAGDDIAADTWQRTVEAIGESKQPEVRGRRRLAQSLLLLRHPAPDLTLLARLISEATEVEASLQAPERTCLVLLRAALARTHEGWLDAASAWSKVEEYGTKLNSILFQRFALLHRNIFDTTSHTVAPIEQIVKPFQHRTPIRWQIKAVGTFACLVDGVPCVLSSLHRTVLIRLLDAGAQGLALERLWEDVWGNSHISVTAIHTALSRLRRQTGLNIEARAGICTIRSPWEEIDYDVRALESTFNTAISHASVQYAMTIYQGDFLPGEIPSARHWAEARRIYLQQRYLDILEQFARMIEDEAPDQAIQHYQRILQTDPYREQTATYLMKLAAGCGKHSIVTKTFELLKEALSSLGMTPDPTTTALYQQLH